MSYFLYHLMFIDCSSSHLQDSSGPFSSKTEEDNQSGLLCSDQIHDYLNSNSNSKTIWILGLAHSDPTRFHLIQHTISFNQLVARPQPATQIQPQVQSILVTMHGDLIRLFRYLEPFSSTIRTVFKKVFFHSHLPMLPLLQDFRTRFLALGCNIPKKIIRTYIWTRTTPTLR